MAALPSDPKIREIMATVCQRNGVPELASKVRVEWNARFTRRMGDANYNKMRIRLSIPLFARAGEDEQEDTIAHEMAHLVAQHKYGRDIKAHGGEWQACMLVAGYRPERCHSVDRTGLARTNKKCKTYCSCGEHLVTPKVYGRVAKGHKYTCRKCHTVLLTAPHAPKPVAIVKPKPQGFKIIRKAQKPEKGRGAPILVAVSKPVVK